MNAIADTQVALPAPKLATPLATPLGTPLTGPPPTPRQAPDAEFFPSTTPTLPLRADVINRPRARRGMLALADGTCALVGALAATLPELNVTLLVGVPLLWVLMLACNRGYESRLVPVGTDDLRRVSRTSLQFAVLGAALLWVLGWHTQRAEVVVLVAVTAALSLGHRSFGVALSRWLRARGTTAARRVVIAGHQRQADQVISALARVRNSAFEVAGVCLPHPAEHAADHSADHHAEERADVHEHYLDELLQMVQRERADAVILLPCDHTTPQVLRRLTWELERYDGQLLVAPGLLDVDENRSTIAYAGGLPMMHIRPAELHGARQVLKTIAERALAAVGLLLLSPVLLSLMLAIRLDSPGSPIFKQHRVGRGGTEFTMLKLRTMSRGADRQVAALGEQNQAGGVLFKIRADPRVTRIGRVLRRYSLDELPQLVNVVCGQMSLVGPRPALPEEVERYEADVHRRLALRPGVTGLWQVSGRSDLSWEESVRLDLAYVDNWSLWADVKILLRTAQAVFGHAGAY